jgi:hypothetical protein
MLSSKLTILLSFFLAESGCELLSKRQYDPVQHYIDSVCTPNLSGSGSDVSLDPVDSLNSLSSLINSPFPCEIVTAMWHMCIANGSTPLDLLAEQECLCNGDYWEVWRGCDDCYFTHGYQPYDPADSASSISALSSAECTGVPTQAFTYLYASYWTTQPTPTTLIGDKFPNNTAVSNYWTASESPVTAGAITGSATARATTISIPGDDVSTSLPSGSSGTSTNGPTKGTSSSNPSPSKNVAARGDMRATGGLLAVVITVIILT